MTIFTPTNPTAIQRAALATGLYADSAEVKGRKVAGLLAARENLRLAMIESGVDASRVAALSRMNAELIGLGWKPVA